MQIVEDVTCIWKSDASVVLFWSKSDNVLRQGTLIVVPAEDVELICEGGQAQAIPRHWRLARTDMHSEVCPPLREYVVQKKVV
jgi:hypothetical protein